MTPAWAPTRIDRIILLQRLVDGTLIDDLAKELQVTRGQVVSVAEHHGYPYADAMRRAITVLRRHEQAGSTPTDGDDRPDPLPSKPALPRARSYERLPLARIKDDPDNPRTSLGDLTELKQSLLAVGILQPPVVRPRQDGTFVLVAGHRRVAAARAIGWTQVDVIIRRDIRDDDALAVMLIENSHRRDLDPIEEARGLRRILEQMGGADVASHNDVAKRVGRTVSHVSGRLSLLLLSPEEQDEVRAGAMTLGEATRRGRLAGGRVRPASVGRPGIGHLSGGHALAHLARARCRRLGHSAGPGKGVGGIACGECWESVIRADERDHLNGHFQRTGRCSVCSRSVSPSAAAVDR